MATRGPASARALQEDGAESILATAATFWPDGKLPDPVIAPPPGVYTIIENGTQLSDTLRAAWPTQKMLRFPPGDAVIHQNGLADLVDGTRTLVDCQGRTWSATDDAVFLTQYNTFMGFYNCTIISSVSPVLIANELVMWHVYNLFDCNDPGPTLRTFFAMFDNGPAYFPNNTIVNNGSTIALFNTTLGCTTADGRLATFKCGGEPPALAQLDSDVEGSVSKMALSTLTISLFAIGAAGVLVALTVTCFPHLVARVLLMWRNARRRFIGDAGHTASTITCVAGSQVGSLPPSPGRVGLSHNGDTPASPKTWQPSVRAEPVDMMRFENLTARTPVPSLQPTRQGCTTQSLLIPTTLVHHTTSVAAELGKLEEALDASRSAGALLCSRYEVLSCLERRIGGQGCVQFLFDQKTRTECAAKFFFAQRHFDHECAMYRDQTLRNVMAATREICANVDGSIRAANGARLPPFIILERGESLNEHQRSTSAAGLGAFGEIVSAAQTLVHTALRIEMLHTLGWVHRDLKPGNVLRVPRLNTWTLIDFGSAARIGEEAPVEFTPRYAAPEVVRAHAEGAMFVTASPAVDVWALGLIALEMLTGAHAFEPSLSTPEVFAALVGQTPLPWERGESDPAVAARLDKLQVFRAGVLACLDRDPSKRPQLGELIESWRTIFTAVVAPSGPASASPHGAG